MGSAPPRPVRLAILACDTPQPEAVARYGSYGGVFTALLSAASKTLSPPQDLGALASVTTHDVVNDPTSYPALADVDALLLTGSRHNAFDDDDWIRTLAAYTRKALDTNRIRLIGVCFGHQIIARALGTAVARSDAGWEIAVTDVDLTDEGKKLFALPKLRIQQMHRDAVFGYPEHAHPLGSNAICANQGMYLPGRYLTVQGHPEFTADIVTEVVEKRHRAGVFNDAQFKDAIGRASLPHDGVAVARAFLSFIQQTS